MKFFSILVGLFLILSPFAVSAESSNEALLLQIESLTKQLREMQSKLYTLQKNNTNTVKTAVFVKTKEEKLNRTLKVGSTGDDVIYLQKFLAKDKNIYPEGLVTGYYGGLTRSAVKRYQEKQGLEVVGSVGPLTRAKINETGFDNSKGTNKVVENKNDSINIYSKKGSVYWDASEEKVKKGMVLLWSKDKNPEYPARERDIWAYFESKLNGSYALIPKSGSGVYFARMCAFDFYTNECDIYSNQIEVKL